jgi:cysteine synthase
LEEYWGDGVLSLIGNTPVVEIKRLNPNPGVRIISKLEGANPCSSVKDRIAVYMIKGAEERGDLQKGMTIVEPTSGNTGIGLAMVAAVRGYKLKVVMPETMSIERVRALKAFGADVILTPGDKGMNGAIELARKMAEEPGVYMPDQFSNPDNVKAHYEGTGPEIMEQVGKVDVLVAGIGTGGTLTGVGTRLREANHRVKIVAVEPFPDSKIQGLKSLEEYVPPILDLSLIDEKVNIRDEPAFEMTRKLASVEGLFVGMSSGAALFEACRQAKMTRSGKIVVIFPDRGDRYLSTECFNVEKE